MTARSPNGFSYLQQDLVNRTIEPFKQATFVFYAFMAIFVFGLLSVWIELYEFCMKGDWVRDEALRTSIITFFPALAGPAALQLVLSKQVSNPLRAFAILLAITFGIIAIVLQFHKGMQASFAYSTAILSCVGSIWLWLLATGKDSSLHDNIDIDASVGGSPEAPPQGDLSGFKV